MTKRESMQLGRREFLRLSGLAGAGALVAACIPSSTTPSPTPGATESPQFVGKYQLGRLEGPVVITDTAKYPKAFKEAPSLATLAQSGRLPAVAQRIGPDPLVVQPLRAIGKYGGTMRRAFNGPGDIQNVARFTSGPDSMLYYDYAWQKLRPNIAKSFELSSDARTLTLTLRKMFWSNGDPLTTDDVGFWYEDIYKNKALVATPTTGLRVNGKDITIRIVDSQTFQLVSPDPHPLLPDIITSHSFNLAGPWFNAQLGLGLIAPSKYLKQFHPKYASGGQAAVDKLAADGKFPGWPQFFINQMMQTVNADCPGLGPWIVRKGAEINKQTWIMDRNPYSIWVDTDGNQLPYIDTLSHQLGENQEVINLRAIAGEYDVQDRFLDQNKLPLIIAGQSQGGYTAHIDPGEGNDFGLRMNWGYNTDPETYELLRMADFRRALSLGIDRGQFNEAFFLGAGTTGNAVPQSSANRYYPGKEAAQKWAQYDVAQANTLLDRLGYTSKDSSGYRLRKDGKGRIILQYLCVSGGQADYPAMGEMLKQQWIKIGLDMNVTALATQLYSARLLVGDFHFVGFSIGSEELFQNPTFAFLTSNPYNDWYNSGGQRGTEPFKELKDLMALWDRGYTSSETERVNIGKQWWTQMADTCLQIGIVGAALSSYGVRIHKNNVENVPARTISSATFGSPRQALPQSYFFK